MRHTKYAEVQDYTGIIIFAFYLPEPNKEILFLLQFVDIEATQTRALLSRKYKSSHVRIIDNDFPVVCGVMLCYSSISLLALVPTNSSRAHVSLCFP